MTEQITQSEDSVVKGRGGHVHGPLEIHPRNIRFDLAEEAGSYWHSGNPVITCYYNGLSLMFPDGERFFMDSVRNYLPEIEDDPVLKSHVQGFLRQEAIHAREHRDYNEAVAQTNRFASRLEQGVERGLKWARKMPRSWQLAQTCADEHFTAILADSTLADPRIMDGATPGMKEIWQWHAVEETEHKAVAYDVYQRVTGGLGGYLLRTIFMAVGGVTFLFGAIAHMLILLWGTGEMFNGKAWAGALKYFLWSPGLFWQALVRYFAYFKPGFHPWDTNNIRYIERWNRTHPAS